MAFLKIFASLAVMVVLTKACSLDEAGIQKVALVCVEKVAFSHPEITGKIAKAMGGQLTTTKAKMDLVCDSKVAVVDVIECILEDLKPCLPSGAENVMSLLPNKERLLQGLQYVCGHKEVLSSNCMDDHMQSFLGCYKGRLQSLDENQVMMQLKQNPKSLVCKIVRTELDCIQENRGSCTKDFIKAVGDTLDAFFGTNGCPVSSETKKVGSTLLSHLLIHGQPIGSLKFQPKGRIYQYKPYVVKH